MIVFGEDFMVTTWHLNPMFVNSELRAMFGDIVTTWHLNPMFVNPTEGSVVALPVTTWHLNPMFVNMNRKIQVFKGFFGYFFIKKIAKIYYFFYKKFIFSSKWMWKNIV